LKRTNTLKPTEWGDQWPLRCRGPEVSKVREGPISNEPLTGKWEGERRLQGYDEARAKHGGGGQFRKNRKVAKDAEEKDRI